MRVGMEVRVKVKVRLAARMRIYRAMREPVMVSEAA
jgi:hypothetical protein